jgi:hypothetical protein
MQNSLHEPCSVQLWEQALLKGEQWALCERYGYIISFCRNEDSLARPVPRIAFKDLLVSERLPLTGLTRNICKIKMKITARPKREIQAEAAYKPGS